MKFRKKPVVIEAWQFNGEDGRSWPRWLYDYDGPYGAVVRWTAGKLWIPTLEGEMCAQPGDWIIRGVKGEVYPVKPDIFAATYEAAEAQDGQGA